MFCGDQQVEHRDNKEGKEGADRHAGDEHHTDAITVPQSLGRGRASGEMAEMVAAESSPVDRLTRLCG